MKSLYMHTLNGQPAQFYPGNKGIYTGLRVINRFPSSLRQVKREQKISTDSDRHNRLAFRYGYVRLQVNGNC